MVIWPRREFTMPDRALKPGKNLMAVRAGQTYGGQCIDVGLVEDGERISASAIR